MPQIEDKTDFDFVRAVRSFLLEFATPELKDEKHVLFGYVNEQSIPPDQNDFCVATIISMVRSGTTIEDYSDSAEDQMGLREYVNAIVQIDCYSEDIFNARDRIQTYEMIARSSKGVEHFRQYGIDCQYAENVRNLSGLLDSADYVSRWSMELRLGYMKVVKSKQQYFETVKPALINVDVKFRP